MFLSRSSCVSSLSSVENRYCQETDPIQFLARRFSTQNLGEKSIFLKQTQWQYNLWQDDFLLRVSSLKTFSPSCNIFSSSSPQLLSRFSEMSSPFHACIDIHSLQAFCLWFLCHGAAGYWLIITSVRT